MALTRPKYSNIVDTDYKASCRIVTTTNITLSGSAPNVYDGVTLAAGNRILVAGQDTGSQNGLYTVLTLGTGSNGTWTRAFDANDGTRLSAGMQTTISEGTYSGIQFRLTTPDPITIGSTSLSFVDGSGVPGGANKQLQYNNSNSLSGATNLVYDNVTGNIVVAATTTATSTTTGALVITGGAGIGGNLWVGSSSGAIGNVIIGAGGGPTLSAWGGMAATTRLYVQGDWNQVSFGTVSANGQRFARGTPGSPTSVDDTDRLGAFFFGGYHSSITGTGWINPTAIFSTVEGSTATVSTALPGKLSFLTTPLNGTRAERMVIAASGNIVVTASATSISQTTGALVITGGAGIGGNVNIGGNLSVTGNLTIQGTTTTLNSTTLDITDLNITVAKGAATAAAANGAGLTVDGAAATILYTNATDTWNFNKGIIATSGSLTGITGAASTFVATNFSTGNLRATGGSVIGITGAASTFVATNFSTGNIWATGGYIDNISIGANVAAQNVNTVNFKAANLLLSGNTVTSGNIIFSSPSTLSYSANAVLPKQYHDAFAVVFGY